jgi:hypothetical protein
MALVASGHGRRGTDEARERPVDLHELAVALPRASIPEGRT